MCMYNMSVEFLFALIVPINLEKTISLHSSNFNLALLFTISKNEVVLILNFDDPMIFVEFLFKYFNLDIFQISKMTDCLVLR